MERGRWKNRTVMIRACRNERMVPRGHGAALLRSGTQGGGASCRCVGGAAPRSTAALAQTPWHHAASQPADKLLGCGRMLRRGLQAQGEGVPSPCCLCSRRRHQCSQAGPSWTGSQAGAAPHHQGQGEGEHHSGGGPAQLHDQGLALHVETGAAKPG